MSRVGGTDRFVLWEKPLAYPFKDIISGTPDGPVFDVVDVDDFDGVVYIKADHVVEMAKSLGMVTGEEVESLHDEIKRLKADNSAEVLVDGIADCIAKFYAGLVAGDSDSGSSGVSDLSDDSEKGGKEESGKSESLAESIGLPDASDGKSARQKLGASKLKGTNELSGNSSDEFGLDL